MKTPIKILLGALLVVCFVGPAVALAQSGGTPIQSLPINTNLPIPNAQSVSSTGPAGLVANLYSFSFLLAGFLAFIMIVYAGILYTFSGGSHSMQSKAKEAIKQAFFGLGLLLLAYLILRTINPDLTTLRLPTLDPYNPPASGALAPLTGFGCAEDVINLDGTITTRVICSRQGLGSDPSRNCLDIRDRCVPGSCNTYPQCKGSTPPPTVKGYGCKVIQPGGWTKTYCSFKPDCSELVDPTTPNPLDHPDCKGNKCEELPECSTPPPSPPPPKTYSGYGCSVNLPAPATGTGVVCSFNNTCSDIVDSSGKNLCVSGCAPANTCKAGSPPPSTACGPAFGHCNAHPGKGCYPTPGKPNEFSCQTAGPAPQGPCGPNFGSCASKPGTSCKLNAGSTTVYSCQATPPPPPPPPPGQCGPNFGDCAPGTGDCKLVPGSTTKYACQATVPTTCTAATPLPPVAANVTLYEQIAAPGKPGYVNYRSPNAGVQQNLTKLEAEMQKFKQALNSLPGNPKPSLIENSAYRPLEYQRHLYEICERHLKLSSNTDPKCKTLKDQLNAERAKHELNASCTVARPGGSAPHVRGIAVDITLTGISYPAANTLLQQKGIDLKWKEIPGDKFHFELLNPPYTGPGS